MKARILVLGMALIGAASARAGSLAYVQCGTYDGYLLLYRTTTRFEELGKLRCGEKVEVLGHSGGYSQIRALDGRSGWVSDADLSEAPPLPQQVYTFGLTESAKDAQHVTAPNNPASGLTNEDILGMHSIHHGSDVILEKIRSSRCAFDMSPEAVQRLHAAGLPDKVILAMLAAPNAPDGSRRGGAESVQVKIPDGTSIEVQLNGNVSSEELKDGTIVEMSASEDLVVDGVPVIVRGSPARARILAVKEPGTHGGTGDVAWFMQDIVATSGEHIPVTFAPKQEGNIRTGMFEGYPYLVSKFHKGDPAIKATKNRFRIVMHGETVMSVSQAVAASLPEPRPKAQSVRQVSTQQAIQAEAAPAPAPQPSPPDEVKP